MKRPLWVIGSAYGGALLLASALGMDGSLWLAAACLLTFAGALFLPAARTRRAVPAALLTAAVAFGVYAGTEWLTVRPLAVLDGTAQAIEAQVLETDKENASCVVLVSGGGVPAGTKIKLWVGGDKALPQPDERIALTADLRLPEEDRPWYKADGVYLLAQSAGYGEDAIQVLGQAPRSIFSLVRDIRERFRRTILRVLPGEEGQLTAAICLGDKSGLSDQTASNFRRAGLSHLLAVSGLHMAIITQACLGLLLCLRVPRRLAAGSVCAVVVFFMLLTGLTPSVVRAGVMCLVMLLAMVISREADSLNSLGLALLLISLCGGPYAVLDVGLQLSFAATLGLVALAPRMRAQIEARLTARHKRRRPAAGTDEEEWRPPAWLMGPCNALCVTVAAMLPTMPIVALTFHELSVVAPLANIGAVYPSTILLVSGCLAMALDALPFFGWAVRGLLFVAGCVAKYLLGFTGMLGAWGPATVTMSRPYLLLWLIGALLLVWLGHRLLGGKGMRRAAALAVIVLACGIGANAVFMRGVTTVTAVDAGDDQLLLLERDGHAGLVARGDQSTLLNTAYFALRERGIRRLDFLLLPDLDRDGAALAAAFAERIAVDSLLYPEQGRHRETADAVPAKERLVYGEADVLTFWDTGSVAFHDGGWIRLQMGDTRLLLCPEDGDTAVLPASWRQTHLAVYMGTPPRHATAIAALGGVLGCKETALPAVTKAAPWGLYPLRLTAVDGDVTAMTRGRGDLTI